MMTPERRKDLLKRSKTTAERLFSDGASRSEARPVLDVLWQSSGDLEERRARAYKVANGLPNSALAKRSTRSRDQFTAVAKHLGPLVRDTAYTEEELRFLLSWTVKNMTIFEAQNRNAGRNRHSHRGNRKEDRLGGR